MIGRSDGGAAPERWPRRKDEGEEAMVNKGAPELGKDQLLSLYRTMLKIRRTEETLVKAHGSGLIAGACHTYIGEEAVATGVCAHLRSDDLIVSTHRGHGHALAKGAEPRLIVAELLGRSTGISFGRGGSMHLFKPEIGLMGTSGIVAASIGQATGFGYAFRLAKTDRVGVSFFGDGASNNGLFAESLNLASIWKLPVLYVCENNMYATEVPFKNVAGNQNVSERAVAYGIPGVQVDGMDVLAVYKAAGEAVRRARAGEGPTLIEAKTCRFRPHSEGMRESGYRSQEEIDSWKARDAIAQLGKHIVEDGIATQEELSKIDAEIQSMAAEALELAKNSPNPDPATVTDHVYSAG
jgi:2-oxoisovalerate dehydrogenase E1 component